MDYQDKYIKYKTKYLELVKQIGRKRKKLKNKHNSINAKTYKNKRVVSNNNMEANYTFKLSEPWFTLISLGLKTVEGRKNKGLFKEMQVGDIIKWTNSDFNPEFYEKKSEFTRLLGERVKDREVLTKLVDKIEYKTFEEYLNTEGLDKCLPGMPSLDHGLSVYFKYFTKEDEKEYGVIALRLQLVSTN